MLPSILHLAYPHIFSPLIPLERFDFLPFFLSFLTPSTFFLFFSVTRGKVEFNSFLYFFQLVCFVYLILFSFVFFFVSVLANSFVVHTDTSFGNIFTCDCTTIRPAFFPPFLRCKCVVVGDRRLRKKKEK